MVKDGKLKCIRSQLDTDFADRVCCVMAMNGTFVKENPTIAKKVAQAVQKAHSYMRDNPEEATKVLMDMGWNGGNYEMNIMINNSLQFGLSDEFTGNTLKDFIERYIRLGLITSMDNADEILDLAWTPVLYGDKPKRKAGAVETSPRFLLLTPPLCGIIIKPRTYKGDKNICLNAPNARTTAARCTMFQTR